MPLENAMSAIALKIGVTDSDRVRPLVDGTVKVENVSASFQVLPVQELFNRQLTEHIFDCCEFPLASYLRSLESKERPYVAVPIFPSRHFRLSCVFLNRKAGIRRPADLAGRRIGIPVFDMAAAVWVRGIFQDYYQLDRTAPVYVTGGLEHDRVGDEHPQLYPAKFKVEFATRNLAQLLESGDIDALYTARAPSTYRPFSDVVRLFDDPMAEETAYFAKTGIFPPMHILCVKRSIFEQSPDVGRHLYAAFSKALDIAKQRLLDSAALSVMLPWLVEHLTSTEKVLGGNYWSAGFSANRGALAKIVEYMRDDGLIATDFAPEDLFADKELLLT
jgi:4,5-dihydroxyphthalate decarboxylase